MLNVIGELVGKLIESELRLYETARLAEHARMESMTDSLTGVFNRRAWQQALSSEETRTARLATPVAIVVFDLDDMKLINDKFGHSAGDELLIKFAKLLKTSLPKDSLVCRIGGDEFTALLIDNYHGEVEKILFDIKTAQKTAGIRASAGFAIRRPKSDLQETWKLADAAMYEQKRSKNKAQAA